MTVRNIKCRIVTGKTGTADYLESWDRPDSNKYIG